MTKMLQRHGKSYALVFDKTMMDALNMTPESPLQVVLSGGSVVVTPIHVYLCQNDAFIDGNKRTLAFSSMLFLVLNGVPEEELPKEVDLERVTLAVAAGAMAKSEVTAWFQESLAGRAGGALALELGHNGDEPCEER